MSRSDDLVEHISSWVGPLSGVFDVGLKGPQVDILHAAPDDDKPFHVLVSHGLSDRVQPTPPEADSAHRVELVMGLDPAWPTTRAGDLTELWPVKLLASLVRFALDEPDGWFGHGHTIPNGSPAQPYVEGGPSGVILLPPVAMPPEFERWGEGEEEVQFLAVVPLYSEELDFKVSRGAMALMERFDAHGLNEVFHWQRRKVAGGVFELL
ncbi:MAG: suppressor of fused domain protein [Myxococcota bacterium]